MPQLLSSARDALANGEFRWAAELTDFVLAVDAANVDAGSRIDARISPGSTQEEYLESISLKLPEDLLEASGRHARALRITRAEYLRRAIERMNRESAARLRAERMKAASLKVRKQSMEVNAEFSRIETDPDA